MQKVLLEAQVLYFRQIYNMSRVAKYNYLIANYLCKRLQCNKIIIAFSILIQKTLHREKLLQNVCTTTRRTDVR